MKIWLLTSETPLFNPGGIARYVDNFSRYLAAEGHEVVVFGRDTEQRDQEIAPGYNYRSVVPKWDLCSHPGESPHPDEHPSYPYNILDYWGAFSYQMAEVVLEEIQRTGPPDIIESQEYTALPYYVLQRKLTETGPLQNIPVVVNAHSPDFVIREFNEEPRYQLPHYWTGRLEKFCLHAADSVICPSNYLTRQLEDLFGGSLKVRHLPLPWTDPGRFTEVIPVVPGKVLYFGRLEVRKGTLKLVRACERLWKKGVDFTLHLVGSDTPYYPRATTVGGWIKARYADRIEEGKLVIRNAVPFGELMHEVKAAAFTVIPSTWENWPNTCIEAMSHGKVVVASRNGGQAEMIGEDRKCGFLFSWENEGEFEKVFTEALHLSEGERREMEVLAADRISRICSPKVILPARLKHLEKVCQGEPKKVFPFVNRRLRESTARSNWVESEETIGRVSVVIPHYNLGNYLEEAVASAVEADWADKEIIVIDDGSKDPESHEVLKRLEESKLPGLRIIKTENEGLASARNRGARLATGQFLLLLDADDAIDPQFIKKSMHVLGRYDNVHIVYSWERYMDSSNDIYPCWNFEFPYLLGHNMTCPISLMYRKSYLSFGPSKQEMAYNFEDFELWINLVKNGCGGVALVEPLSRYRIRKNSMWQDSPRDQHLFLQDLIARFHPELYQEYGAELFGLLNANGSSQKWIKPCAFSPFDEYERWSRKRIANLEEQARKWWETSTDLDRRLKEAGREKDALWREKVALQEKLEKPSDPTS